jgi:riboflavin-specific deaminase-like protein
MNMPPGPFASATRSLRPFVRLNLAITADGKIATANHKIFSFGSRRDLELLFKLRRRADAVLCGATTINDVNADLGPGKSRGNASRQVKLPLRVVVSGQGNLKTSSRLFRRSYGPIIVLTTARISPVRLRRLQSLARVVKICGTDRVDFVDALRWLRSEWNVRELLCEGGGQVNAALIEADLVDEIRLTICPWIVGGRSAPTIADGRGVATLSDASVWRLARARRVGDEMFLTYRRLRTG